MGKVAFVFPGQGSQKVGMGKAAFDASPDARAVFEAADRALGEPLSRLCFDGPEEALRLTANTQPAVLTASVALVCALGGTADGVAGHSLGEYTAHVCAGTLAFDDAVRLVRARGRLMQDAVPLGTGGMVAVMGLAADRVQAICHSVDGIVEPVNFNSPGQIVIAGRAEAVAACAERLRDEGAKTIPLPVSAPFHSSLMAPAADALAPMLRATPMRDPSVPVYVNVDARPARTASAALDALIRQVACPVLWEPCVRAMVADGFSLFVEVGPGRVLADLITRIDKTVSVASVQSPEDFAPIRERVDAVRHGS